MLLAGVDEAAFGQQRGCAACVTRGIEHMTLGEAAARAHRVQPADEAAQAHEHRVVFEFGRAPGTARRHGIAVQTVGRGAQGQGVRSTVGQQAHIVGRCVDDARRHHRHLGGVEFQRKRMLFDDLRIAPATAPVELCDHRVAVFEHHLEHPVLIGVELQDAPIAAQTDVIQCVEHLGWCQVGIAGGRNAHVAMLRVCRAGRRNLGAWWCRLPWRLSVAPARGSARSAPRWWLVAVTIARLSLVGRAVVTAARAATQDAADGAELAAASVGARVRAEERILEEARVLPQRRALPLS